MAVRALLPALLTTALRRGWLSERAATNVQSLVAHGIHPEQALVGTGLLHIDQYAELLSDASGLPFVQVPAESIHQLQDEDLHEHLHHTKAIPLVGGSNELLLGFAEPHAHHMDALEQKLKDKNTSMQKFVVSHADWKRNQEKTRKPVSTVRDLFLQAQQRGARHITIEEAPNATLVAWKRHTHTPEQWPASLLSELLALFRRTQEYQGWMIDEQNHGGHRRLQLQRVSHQKQADHPLDWSHALGQFFREPKGVLVVETGDTYILKKLAFRFVDEDQTGEDEPGLYQIKSEEQREDALHESLLGRPLVVIDTAKLWTDRLSSSGVPLVCVTQSRHPEGIAWCVSRHD